MMQSEAGISHQDALQEVPQFHIPPNIRSSLGDELLIMVVKRV